MVTTRTGSYLNDLSAAIKLLQVKGCEESATYCFTVDDSTISPLLICLDNLFTHGLKNPTHGYWNAMKYFCPQDVIHQVEGFSCVHSRIGRSRSWLYISLNEKILESVIRSIQENPNVIQTMYFRSSLLLSPEMQMTQEILYGLEFISFSLDPNSSYLDISVVKPSIHQTPRIVPRIQRSNKNTGSSVYIDVDSIARNGIKFTKSIRKLMKKGLDYDATDIPMTAMKSYLVESEPSTPTSSNSQFKSSVSMATTVERSVGDRMSRSVASSHRSLATFDSSACHQNFDYSSFIDRSGINDAPRINPFDNSSSCYDTPWDGRALHHSSSVARRHDLDILIVDSPIEVIHQKSRKKSDNECKSSYEKNIPHISFSASVDSCKSHDHEMMSQIHCDGDSRHSEDGCEIINPNILHPISTPSVENITDNKSNDFIDDFSVIVALPDLLSNHVISTSPAYYDNTIQPVGIGDMSTSSEFCNIFKEEKCVKNESSSDEPDESDGEDTRQSDGEDTRQSDGEDTRQSDGEDTRQSDGEDTRQSDGENTRQSVDTHIYTSTLLCDVTTDVVSANDGVEIPVISDPTNSFSRISLDDLSDSIYDASHTDVMIKIEKDTKHVENVTEDVVSSPDISDADFIIVTSASSSYSVIDQLFPDKDILNIDDEDRTDLMGSICVCQSRDRPNLFPVELSPTVINDANHDDYDVNLIKKINNNVRLHIMLEILICEDEQILAIIDVNFQQITLLISDHFLYFMHSSSDLYVRENYFSYQHLVVNELLNKQGIVVSCLSSTNHYCYTADIMLTQQIMKFLMEGLQCFHGNHEVKLVASIVCDSVMHEESLRKLVACYLGKNAIDCNITMYFVVNWKYGMPGGYYGSLLRKSGKILRRWNDVYCVLDDGILYIYSNKLSLKPDSSLILEECVGCQRNNQCDFNLVVSDSYVIEFRAYDEENATKWLDILTGLISCQDKPRNLSSLLISGNRLFFVTYQIIAETSLSDVIKVDAELQRSACDITIKRGDSDARNNWVIEFANNEQLEEFVTCVKRAII